MIRAKELDVVLTKSHGKVTILEVYEKDGWYLVEGPDLPESLELNVFTMPFDEVTEIVYSA
ncbi:hypothetical protein SFC08_14640 [Lysinibacillus halotolerans]